MTSLLHNLLSVRGATRPEATALRHRGNTLAYGALALAVESCARALQALGLERHARVAVFLPKQFEAVIAMFGAAQAGLVFVPVNPILKAAQVEHILRDCNVRVLVTSAERAEALQESLGRCPDLQHLVRVSAAATPAPAPAYPGLNGLSWSEWLGSGGGAPAHRVIDADMAAILYTSGSTGKPKGVVLSHRNLVTGAHSVAEYLENTAADRLLAVLPFSFDYGFSQLSTAMSVGASVILMEYLFARDILQLAAQDQATALAGVPPLWSQLADLEWPREAVGSIRYLTNSGGAMPAATLQKLRRSLPQAQVYLMYGLTEAFRSTYLPPSEIDHRAGSMGKAIPNAEIMVVRPDGTRCEPGEPGELVHRGSLVALGYWNDPEKTAERFRPVPAPLPGLVLDEIAVWSGDTVKSDEDGYLYFVGRRDEMIKTSGYRVSPSEVEEVLFATGLVADAAAIGVPHATLGQAIVVVAAPVPGGAPDTKALLDACRRELPTFMVPAQVDWREHLPRNPNGKYDRARLATELRDLFAEPAS
jgi:acyl-CoA ligase (AMP-forming) (exosortase A-associated)